MDADHLIYFVSGEVPEFLLGYNPFFCDCEMEWLQKINQMAHHRQHPRVLDLDNVYCKLNNRDPKSKTTNSFHRQHYFTKHSIIAFCDKPY